MEEKQQSASEFLTGDTLDDTHLTELIAAAAEEVPDTLISGVWLKINAERKRRRQARFMKYAGVAACLLIVLPMAIRILPMLQNTKSADTATREAYSLTAMDGIEYGDGDFTSQETAAATTTATAFGIMTFSAGMAETEETTAGNSTNAPAETVAETTTATAAPKLKRMIVANNSSTAEATAQTLADRAETVLRSMSALSVTYETYAQTAETPSPADFIQKYKISSEDFLAVADTLNMTFSENEIAELWG